jgi:hypothetical protein
VSFNLALQILPFMKGIPTQMVHTSQPLTTQADTRLGAKLYRLIQLAANYDPAHIELADDPIITTTAFAPIHFPLLCIDMLDYPVAV